MIPVKMFIKGFLSYREKVEIDFSKLDVACVSGMNGAGKSSLFDAMTWVLFGKARRNDDALINDMADACAVALEFEYENNLYRIYREKPREKTGLLKFEIRSSDIWKSLTEATMRDTDARIQATLRMDYDTFINASFFLQGKADLFTQQPPAKRKEILGNILGLEVWESYREEASKRRRNVNEEIKGKKSWLAEIETELNKESELREKLRLLTEKLEAISMLCKEREKTLAAAKEKSQALESEKQQIALMESNLATEQQRLIETQNRIHSLAGEITKQQNIVSNAEKIAADYKKLQEIRQTLESMDALSQQFHELSAQKDKNTAAIMAEIARLSGEIHGKQASLKAQMNQIKEHMDKFNSLEAGTCPTCGQELSQEHKQKVLDDYTAKGKELGDQYRANEAELQKIQTDETIAADERAEIVKIEEQINVLNYDENEHARLKNEKVFLQSSEQQYQALEKARTTIEGIQRELSALEQNRDSFVQNINSQTAVLEKAQQELSAKQTGLVDIATAERELSSARYDENNLHGEIGSVKQSLETLDQNKEKTVEINNKITELSRQEAKLRTLEVAFGKDGIPTLLIEHAIPEIETQANEILERLTDGRMSILFETEREYKDKKREDKKQTLDILISDAMGRREYELFSGGEAFRINFAIRLALSRVLAGRAGARLQTLVIDEGFGSQDAEGRQKLIEAINMIRNDFKKILVITHLEELKDAFPERIEVSKVNGSSQIALIA